MHSVLRLLPPLLANIIYHTPGQSIRKLLRDHLPSFTVLQKASGAAEVCRMPPQDRRGVAICRFWQPFYTGNCYRGAVFPPSCPSVAVAPLPLCSSCPPL